MSRSRSALVIAIWCGSLFLAIALPLLFVSLSERICLPPELDPNTCQSWVRSSLFWMAWMGGAAVGAAAMVVYPASAAPPMEATSVAAKSFLAGAAALALLLLLATFVFFEALPALLGTAVATLAAGAASVWVVRRDQRNAPTGC